MPDKSIDDILAELKGKTDRPKDQLEELLEDLGSTPPVQTGKRSDLSIDALLADMASNSIGLSTAQPPPQTTNFITDRSVLTDLQKVETDLKQQKIDRAKAWLQALDPLSAEGIWFQEFAKHYPSELEAAVDYLP